MVAAAPPLLASATGNRIRLQANSPALQPLSVPRLVHRFGEFAQRGVQLPTAAFGQLGLPLVQQTVGEGVLAGGVRGFGLLIRCSRLTTLSW